MPKGTKRVFTGLALPVNMPQTMPKGTHVIEYEMRAVHKGNFSDGVTTCGK